MNDSDQAVKGTVKIDFARFGFKPGEVKCRDYGAAGLAYPEAPFCQQKKTVFDPQKLPVQDTVVSAGTGLPVELGRHSFKLMRFHQ